MRTELAFRLAGERVQILAVPAVADRTVMPQTETEEELDFDRISQLGFDDYRIALIPPQRGIGHDGSRRPSDITSSMLVLSLTWKQLCTHPSRERGGVVDSRNSTRFGDVDIDFQGMEVRRSNRLVSLTAMEFKVLKFFVLNPRRAISRDALLNQVWGYNNYPYSRTVDNHIMRLRHKLEADCSRPIHFQTVHGVGYKFVP